MASGKHLPMVPGGAKRPAHRPRGSFSSAIADLVLLTTMVRNQAKIYRWKQEQLIRKLVDAAGVEPAPASTLTDSDRDDLIEINNFLARVAPSMVAAISAKAKLNKSLPTEELESQLRDEIQRSAATLTDEEWAAMAAARAKARAT